MRLSSLEKILKKVPASGQVRNQGISSFPAPTGGLNARDPLEFMPVTDAVQMLNMYPTTTDVRVAGRVINSALAISGSATAGSVQTLMTYNSGATAKLFAVTSTGKIADVSTIGTNGTSVVTGLTNGYWEYVNFTTSGGSYILAVNGTDSLENYDGTNWQAVTGVSAPYAITGVTTSTLSNVFIYKKRVFFVEKSKLKLWYLAVDSFQGAATAFDISSQFKKGGYIVDGGALTRDGGDGIDDLFVVISNNGEVVIYQGTDPGTDFVLVGRYEIAPPIGSRALSKFGAGLLALTQDGVFNVSDILSIDRSKQKAYALSDKVRNLYNSLVASNSTKKNWEFISFPKASKFLINVPTNDAASASAAASQLVQNSVTNAWGYYNFIGAMCWALYNDRLVRGGGGASGEGNVAEYDELGTSNTGATGTCTFNLQTVYRKLGKSSLTVKTLLSMCLNVYARPNREIIPVVYTNLSLLRVTSQTGVTRTILPNDGAPNQTRAFESWITPPGVGGKLISIGLEPPSTSEYASASEFFKINRIDVLFEEGGIMGGNQGSG